MSESEHYANFNTHPSQYKHWKLQINGAIARLEMDVNPSVTFAPGYELKLNSYDLGVDIELNDAVERIRFEHPGVKVVILTSAHPKVFSAGANIFMLQQSNHHFKVNFCKFTNETRLAIEEASLHSDQTYLAALNGATAGGGYELALACAEIYLVDDGNSTVSLPEVSLLGVLPGTGGLTRLVDKRNVRPDHADIFSTLGEGIKGKKAKEWNLIDDTFPKSQFDEAIQNRAQKLVDTPNSKGRAFKGIALKPLTAKNSRDLWEYDFVQVELDRKKRLATLTLKAPQEIPGHSIKAIVELGSEYWPLKIFRELNDALLRLRFDESEIGLVVIQTRGNGKIIREIETNLFEHRDHWFIREVILYMGRTLCKLETTAKSLFAIIDKGSCFYGCLFEVALACDRSYILDNEDEDRKRPVSIALGPLSDGLLSMANGLSRLRKRFLSDEVKANKLAGLKEVYTAREANQLGLVTVMADSLDWQDEIRLAIEERLSLSPDALTGMEASLRFGGPETCASKIFGRLSAWQNWIFVRPNAIGERGALNVYGKSEGPQFDWRRT